MAETEFLSYGFERPEQWQAGVLVNLEATDDGLVVAPSLGFSALPGTKASDATPALALDPCGRLQLPQKILGIEKPDDTGRRYVKPIECLCRPKKAATEPEEEEGEEDQACEEGEQQDPGRAEQLERYPGNEKTPAQSRPAAAGRRQTKNSAGKSRAKPAPA